MSRAQLTSTVEQSSGGAVAPFLAGKNKIINGDFGVWQRGTSFSSGVYTADRWVTGYINGGISLTWSQVAFDYGSSPASDKLPISGQNGTYFARSSIASASATYAETFVQKIEDVKTFANQTIAISFWAKSDSARTQTLAIYQLFGSGGLATAGGGVSTFNTTTSWQRFTFTTTPASIVGKTIGAGSNIGFYIAQAVASGSVLDLWGVQVEAGSVATPFTTASNTLQGELSLCQRYYWRNNGDTFSQLGAGTNASTTAAYIQVSAPVTMRTIPTAIDYANLSVYDSASYPGVSAISFLGNQSSPKTFGINCTSTSLTQFRPVFLICNNNINGYLGFSAEL